ncbi:MAG: type II secretion system protein [bacterium]
MLRNIVILKKQKGFTLLELVVMLSIIIVLATIITITLGAARVRTRDAKRISNIQEIKTALEDYYFDENEYPSAITAGNPLIGPTSTKTYLSTIPNNPTPRNDGSCPDNDYIYTQDGSGTSYHIIFCLGVSLNELSAGTAHATPQGIFSQ